MPKYRIWISYDGTDYGGWQVQPNSTSIQGLIEEALETILRQRTPIVGSGRTDAGVHAEAQVAHFSSDIPFELNRLQRSLNALLPPDIRIMKLDQTEPHFHARYSATGKIYHYHLHTANSINPFSRLYSTHFPYPLDLSLIHRARDYLIGTHDFTSFANECTKGSAAKNPIRTLKRLDIVQIDGGIRFEFEADGFLYKMVRNLTGTLLDVATGKIEPESIPAILEAKDRTQAGRAAPPQGLFLMQVHYPVQFSGMASKEAKCVTSPSG